MLGGIDIPALLASGLLAAEGEQGSALGMLMPILIVVVIFWLLVFRPASRERKEREGQIKALKKHDKVITNAGIHGTVMSLDDESVVLRIDDKNNVRVKFSRAAIWQVLGGDTAATSS